MSCPQLSELKEVQLYWKSWIRAHADTLHHIVWLLKRGLYPVHLSLGTLTGLAKSLYVHTDRMVARTSQDFMECQLVLPYLEDFVAC